jgi:predicted HicB family RNase H-like nuclease
MLKPYTLSLTKEEKITLQALAEEMGISLNELVNKALYEALEANGTGVHLAGEDDE